MLGYFSMLGINLLLFKYKINLNAYLTCTVTKFKFLVNLSKKMNKEKVKGLINYTLGSNHAECLQL